MKRLTVDCTRKGPGGLRSASYSSRKGKDRRSLKGGRLTEGEKDEVSKTIIEIVDWIGENLELYLALRKL